MEFRVIGSLSEAWDVVDRLNDLSYEPSPFLTSRYLRAWDTYFSATMEKLVIAGVQGEKVRGAGLFYLREKPSTYFLIGGKSLSDRLGFVIERGFEQKFIGGFFAYLAGMESMRGSRFVINNVNGGTPQQEVLEDIRGKTAGLKMETVDSSPYIELPADFDAYLMSLSGKQRHELRRKIKRASEGLGGIRVDVVDGRDASRLPLAMEEFVRLHSSSNTGKLNFWKGRRREFFDAIAGEFGEAGWLKILFLLGGSRDERVAALMIFDYGGDYLLYNSGFDPAHRRSSPGIVLISDAIKRAIGEGRKRFDFLRGEERYKYELGSRNRAVYRVEFDV
ncbi:MAG: GNAT family N-acetyltransferase [Deltaproteobacteria bacterium]|nr:GNAT family N-acetyltransferase [Deltaproteobacteria bacterium]NIS76489.1 GNAT family N-acetyltransferase [Deltaproteobacteria bacterium]